MRLGWTPRAASRTGLALLPGFLVEHPLRVGEFFRRRDVSADKDYGTVRNADTIASHGGTPFIAFKSSHTGKGGHGHSKPTGSGAWSKMYGYFVYRSDEFMAHYHRRSNIESTFSMIKRKFGDSPRTKTDTAMVNEVLCKVLCHNLVVLIHEMYELGISPVFEAKQALAS